MNEMDFARPLLLWYNRDKRNLPWRRTKDPYRIWVSEIMLQQTRAETVIGYYERFLKALPDIGSLAACPDDDLMKLWEGLGYYSRARNLKKAAQVMVESYGGHFPENYDAIRALPGIGDYTAGAISSIAFGLNEPAVDGNVLRVAARFSGSEDNVLSGTFKKNVNNRIRAVMAETSVYLDGEGIWRAGDFNQSLIELGAMICVPKGTPKCDRCPLAAGCAAGRTGSWDHIPVRKKPSRHRTEERTVLLILDERRVILDKRPDRGLLAGMYEFPNVAGHMTEQAAFDEARRMGFLPVGIRSLGAAKHVFSHLTWEMIGYEIRVTRFPEAEDGVIFADRQDLLRKYALPTAFGAYEKAFLHDTAPERSDDEKMKRIK